MRIDAATAFSLGDLAVFDATHWREVITTASGAVPPALAGWAFACDGARKTPSLDDLAERIERALSRDDHTAFAHLDVSRPSLCMWLTSQYVRHGLLLAGHASNRPVTSQFICP